MDLFCVLLVVVFIISVLLWYKFAYAPYQVFKKYGIPHPPVTPFFGNTLQIQAEGFMQTTKKWLGKYGKVYGLYIGAKPELITTDTKVIKEITVKLFDKFTYREETEVFLEYFSPESIFVKKGNDWRSIRSIVSPSFSLKKLKTMVPIIERSCDSLIKKLKNIQSIKKDQSIEMLSIFGQFTMESTLACLFGCEVNLLQGEGNELTEAAFELLSFIDSDISLWLETFHSHFPFCGHLIPYAKPGAKVLLNKLHIICSQLIQTRRQSQEISKQKDLLQLLIDATSDEQKMLTDEEIFALTIDFLLAGYETLSNCLTYTSYLLAINTDKQDKLLQIIENYYKENPDATLYDGSQNIEYLDWVVSESLRMYPPTPQTTRYCTETCTVEGVTIPKGVTVYIPINELHHSIEYWDEPSVFRPERFSPEEKESRDRLCYIPFGWGPRGCVGVKFALLNVKMAILNILNKYKFCASRDTEIPLKITVHLTQKPTNGVYLQIIEH